MKNFGLNIYGVGCMTALLLVLSALLPAGALRAQVKINHGVDMSTGSNSLFTPGNFIYFGHYKHATKLEYKLDGNTYTNRGTVVERENSETPIVWRVMGEENSDGKVTLMSEYVLESRLYGNANQMWGNSEIKNWLNSTSAPDDFGNSFTDLEWDAAHATTVYAPSYNYSTASTLTQSSTSSSTSKFYLPWGTPNQNGSLYHRNRVFWTVGDSGGTIPTAPADSVSTDIKGAGLKGGLFDPFFNVYYWLRPKIYSVDNYMLLVKSDGALNLDGIGVEMGVRPIFKLDTANILFAAELMEVNSISRVDQMVADNKSVYTDEDALPNGGHGGTKSAYKLTLWNGLASLLTSPLAYDIDESVYGIADTVGFKPGERLGFKQPTTLLPTIDTLAYKIVSDTHKLMHYGDTLPGADTIRILADDIYTPTVKDAAHNDVDNLDWATLNGGTTHTVYVWAQENNPTQSNTGYAPLAFTMKVLADDVAPELERVDVIRYPNGANFDADVKFRIKNDVAGKFYYLVDPPAPVPETFDDFVSAPLPTKTPFKLAAAGDLDSIMNIPFTDNGVHHIYIVAKDEVRNISNVLHIQINPYIEPVAPEPLNPAFAVDVEVGQTVHFDADSIATDANLPDDLLTIIDFSTLNPIDGAIATLNIAVGVATVHGVTVGLTDVDLVVEDHSYLKDTITVPVTVREQTPTITIDYIEEWLLGFVNGSEYSFNGSDPVEMGAVLDSISEDWFDTTVSIVRVNANPLLNSKPQLLYIPPRPAPPAVYAVRESFPLYSDGQIMDVNPTMEYRPDTIASWTDVFYGAIIGLSPGVYQVRYRAVADVSFAGHPAYVEVDAGTPVTNLVRAVYLPDLPNVTELPSPGVHYAESSGSFSFSLKFAGSPLSVHTNRLIDGVREELTGTINAYGAYDYTITNIVGSTPVVVYIGPETVGNETVATQQSVWSYDGQIYVEAWRNETVSVYALNGHLVKQVNVAEGITSIPVGQGVYVVLLRSGVRRKVSVN